MVFSLIWMFYQANLLRNRKSKGPNCSTSDKRKKYLASYFYITELGIYFKKNS